MKLPLMSPFTKFRFVIAVGIVSLFPLTQSYAIAQEATPEVTQRVNWQPPPKWEPVPPHREERGSISIIWLAGTPYEMGVQQAELLGEDIKALGLEALDTLDFFGRTLGLALLAIRRSYSPYIEECRGLADGLSDEAGESIMTMDACMMLAFGDVYQEVFGTILPSILFNDGCSSFIVAGDATVNGNLYHAHTLDNSFPLNHLIQNPTLVIRQPTGGIPYVSVTAPGAVIPTQAMNAAGISISINSARPKDFADLSLDGTSNVQMMGEVMWRASSLETAIKIFQGKERMRANIIAIADGKQGKGAVLELMGFESTVRSLDEKGTVYASNHFAAEEFVERDLPNPSSESRFHRYQQLLEPDGQDSVYGNIDPKKAITVLRDRVNPATGNETPRSVFDDDLTIGGNGPLRQVVFEPASGLFWVASGTEPPVPEAPFTCFSLSQLLGFPNAVSCPTPAIE